MLGLNSSAEESDEESTSEEEASDGDDDDNDDQADQNKLRKARQVAESKLQKLRKASQVAEDKLRKVGKVADGRPRTVIAEGRSVKGPATQTKTVVSSDRNTAAAADCLACKGAKVRHTCEKRRKVKPRYQQQLLAY